MGFERVALRSLAIAPFSLIADEWMLITAGSIEKWNTMTASWGGFGHLWNRDVAFVFVRPTRHTYGFMESSPVFSLSFFDPDMRKTLQVCGSVSGRDVDKARAACISPRSLDFESGDDGSMSRIVSFDEARLVLACRKLHAQDLDPSCFVDPGIAANYPERDYHRFYVGAIEASWQGC